MGWTVVTDSVTGPGIYLFGLLILWQIPHFMAISLYRKNDYSMASILTFAQTHSKNFMQWNIFLYSVFILFYGLGPYFMGWRGVGYAYASLTIGIILALWPLYSWKTKTDVEFNGWARSYFFATIFYLPLQLMALLILR
jgi:protoheme IX farnesyltransferase